MLPNTANHIYTYQRVSALNWFTAISGSISAAAPARAFKLAIALPRRSNSLQRQIPRARWQAAIIPAATSIISQRSIMQFDARQGIHTYMDMCCVSHAAVLYVWQNWTGQMMNWSVLIYPHSSGSSFGLVSLFTLCTLYMHIHWQHQKSLRPSGSGFWWCSWNMIFLNIVNV